MHTSLSSSTRFIIAVLRLSADIADGFGAAIIGILRKQYPEMIDEMKKDERYAENPAATIGHKLVAIARKQLQYNEQDAYDAIQDFLTYLASSNFDFKAKSKKGNPGAATWQKALDNIYANMRARAMSHSFKKFRPGKVTDEEKYANLLWFKNMHEKGVKGYRWDEEKEKELKDLEKILVNKKVDIDKLVPTKLRRKNIRNKTLDEAFGKRDEGGEPSGGIGNIPDSHGSPGAGLPLDDKAAKKSFLDTLDEVIPDLEQNLPDTAEGLPAQRLLFKFIFNEDDSGSFFSGPNDEMNMGQASEFKKYLEGLVAQEGPDSGPAKAILNRYGKRWSGFVGDTRKRLLGSIQKFTDEYLPESEYDELWQEFYSDTTPKSVEKKQTESEQKKKDYQRGLDLRKIIRLEEKSKLGKTSPKDEQDLSKLRKRVEQELVDDHMQQLEQWNQYVNKLTNYTDQQMKNVNLRGPRRPKKTPDSLNSLLDKMSDYREEQKKELESESKKDEAKPETKPQAEQHQGVAAFFKRFFPQISQ